MKKSWLLLLVLVVASLAASTWFIGAETFVKFFDENEPDLPPGSTMDKEAYLKLRAEHTDMLQGFDTARQDSRAKAVADMERSERRLAELRGDSPEAVIWTPLGPAPIPVGGGNSGRTSAIAIHPTNPDIAYVGTAQGGLYRTLNGGATWTPLMDSALTLAIGAVAIAPSDPTTVYVGTGESTLCGSGCFIGVGVYRINNADTSPVLTGPLNRDGSNNDIFTGRAISEVLVHPTDANTIFVSTTSGIAGIGSNTTGLPLPIRGIYRSTNVAGADPTFALLNLGISERNVTDIVMEPGNPSRIYAGVVGVTAGDGGVYVTSNALDAAPSFTPLLNTTLTGSNSRVELAANKVGPTTTVIAASGEGTGTVWRSVDGAPFTMLIDNNFCNPQCFYDIAVAIDPTDANKVYLGGSPTIVFAKSTTGGVSFTSSSAGLHVDTQAIAVAPSNPSMVYFASDGGIWRTNDVNVTPIVWNSLNNTTFSATQFMGIALHPLDRNYSLGGTQDNGTEFLFPNGTQWVRSAGGDGGFAVIDKTSPTINNVTAYHTFFNQTSNQIGFSRAMTTVASGDPIWGGLLGCGGTANGINCADATLFYAPMVGGPVAPDSAGKNTLYFGTNKLYRSANTGTTMAAVSQTLPNTASNERVSAIGIAPQNDDVRLIGSTIGRVYLSITPGATTMTDVTGAISPARYIGRIAIDPTNANVAYVALNGFGAAAGQHIWKTSNLLSGAPSWIAAGSGIPDTPVNTLAIDPANTQVIYAGSDIGVFKSNDGGGSWIPFSNGLPRVAVFGMEIQPIHRVLRIATHGRGMYEFALNAAATPFDYDGDRRTDVSTFRPSTGVWYVNQSTAGVIGFGWGIATDKIAPADYDGDAKTDIAVYRPSEGRWYIFNSSTSTVSTSLWGVATDIPAPGDFDNDGKADVAIFRPSDGNWWLNRTTAGTIVHQFGGSGDHPVVGDYDGDGRADIAAFRPSTGVWYIFRSTTGPIGYQFGVGTDKVAPADYDGDGKTDIAVYRPSEGKWYIVNSGSPTYPVHIFGAPTDIPAPGDYDGDGRADIAIFRPSDGNWWINRTTAGLIVQQFGQNGDKPTPNAFGN